MIAKYGEFVNQCTVEHHVGIFLIREYPFVLSSTHTWPTSDGATSAGATELIVANDAANQSVVGGWHVVVVVEFDGGQCRNVDAEFLLFRNTFRHERIECVDAFHEKDGVRLQFEVDATLHALARWEVVAWQLHFLAVEQLFEMLMEEVEVERVDGFVVVFTVLVDRSAGSIYKVIVE